MDKRPLAAEAVNRLRKMQAEAGGCMRSLEQITKLENDRTIARLGLKELYHSNGADQAMSSSWG